MKFRVFILFFLVLGQLSQAEEKQIKIVVVGDSIAEGYGVTKESAFPNRLEKKLHESGFKNTEVVNAGVAGSTAASGPSRMKWILKSKPQIVILELGANDGLRGLNVDNTKKNLSEVIEIAQKEHIKLLLTGMRAPPNYGVQYTNKFNSMYPELAKKYNLAFMPFLLEGVGGETELNQADGIHPNEKGHQIVADKIFKYLKPLL